MKFGYSIFFSGNNLLSASVLSEKSYEQDPSLHLHSKLSFTGTRLGYTGLSQKKKFYWKWFKNSWLAGKPYMRFWNVPVRASKSLTESETSMEKFFCKWNQEASWKIFNNSSRILNDLWKVLIKSKRALIKSGKITVSLEQVLNSLSESEQAMKTLQINFFG